MPNSESERTTRERHRPPHFGAAGDTIFVTAATVRRVPHLRSPARKDGFLELLQKYSEQCRVRLIAWVILDEHYHAIFRPASAMPLPVCIGSIHSAASTLWNEEDITPGRQCLYQYW